MTSGTAVLPGPVRTKLAATRRKLRAVDLSLGVARALLAALVVLVLLFALDTALEPPLMVLRAFALFMAVVAAAVSTVFLVLPLRRPLTDDDVALLLERRFPELEDGLVSTVQLARELDSPRLFTSRALIASVIDRTAQRSAGLDFGQVVSTKPLVPLFVLLAACIGLGAMLAGHPTTREYVSTFYKRVVLGEDLGYPKLVRLEVLSEKELAVAKGDDLSVDVRIVRGAGLVQGLVVHTGYYDEAQKLREPLEKRDLLRVGPGLFRKAYQNITESFVFWAEDELHGVTSTKHTVRVVQRPRVEAYEFLLRYPAYTGKPPQTLAQPDLVVPVGTEVSYVVVTNKPLETASLVFETDIEKSAAGGRKKKEVEARPGPAPIFHEALPAASLADNGDWAALAPALRKRLEGVADPGRRAFVGRFVVNRDVRFRFSLMSREATGPGYDEGKKPVVFSVVAQQDQKPIVNIPVPGRRKVATPQGVVLLVVDAKDDYGLQSIELRLRPQRPGEAAPQAVQAVPLPGLEPNARAAKLNWRLQLSDLRLQPGDVLHYLALASDKNLDEAARTRESRSYEVQVVRPDDLERMLQDRITGLKERLEAAAKEEAEAKTAMSGFVSELGPKDLLTDDDKRRLARVDQDQRRITQRLEELKADVDDIRSERELNRLQDDAAMGLVQELQESLRQLAERDSPLISRELDDARQAPRVDDKLRARLARVPDRQQEVVEKLQSLAARIGKWGDFTEVLQEVRDLLRGEDKVIDGTKRAAQGGN